LKESNTFGELALLNNAPRAATVRCLTDCEFATLDRADFEKVLKKIENKVIANKVDFFKNLTFVQHMTQNQLKKFVSSFSVKHF